MGVKELVFENKRLQEGILLDKMKIRVGVTGLTRGAGATFTSESLEYYLNIRGKERFFVSRPDKYMVVDDPACPADMDLMVMVIDPIPSALKKGSARYAVLKELDVPKLWLVNRDNEGVDHREMERFLELKPDFFQQDVPYDVMCRAEYSLRIPQEIYRFEGLEALADRILKEYM